MSLIKPVQAIIENPVIKNSANIGNDPKSYLNGVIQILFDLLIIFGVIYFVYHFILAGFKMMSSMGDPKKYEEAQQRFLYSGIGLVLIFCVFALLKLIGSVFGITGLSELNIAWPSF